MEQTYNPNIGVKATAGYCLQYVDDAGNAPQRTKTAKIAYDNERNAGRIQLGDTPDNVWVVGFLSFTVGSFVNFGHVFFIKRNGSSIQIYDSEVQSGARRPYGSIAELLGWFGAYKPKYLGWSTHCDGREYAKNKGDDMITKEQYVQAAQAAGFVWGKDFNYDPNKPLDEFVQMLWNYAPVITREMESALADKITGIKSVIGKDYNSPFVGNKVTDFSNGYAQMVDFWVSQRPQDKPSPEQYEPFVLPQLFTKKEK